MIISQRKKKILYNRIYFLLFIKLIYVTFIFFSYKVLSEGFEKKKTCKKLLLDIGIFFRT